ncbi:Hsp70 family protein [Asanoa sp. NPDC049518]|uniref:Hsp70 family protein n=1 Tax=unclassified Asanoa TaxID=2685164 RepID=UPI00341F2FFB
MVVDYGTLTTAALVSGGDDGWAPLTVDGVEVCSSAVLVQPDGSTAAGQQAWRGDVNGHGGGFVADPLRLGRGRATIGGVELDVADLACATLRLFADAARADGAAVREVRLVVPVGWGPRRRRWLRQAANRAGLHEASLVDAPVAAAQVLTNSAQLQARVGDYVLVVDLGAGCEATMLRRTPAGFETISALDDAEAGGRTLDHLLLDHLDASRGALAATLNRASVPTAVPQVDDDRVGLASVRAAVEALSSAPAVTVAMSAPHPPMVLTAAAVEAMAGPVWRRAGELALEAIAAADLDPAQVSAVICVGGAANNPAAVRAVADAVGQKPLVPHDPGRAALWGAAGAAPATGDQVDAFDGSWAAARAVARQVPALVVAGVASLAMFGQFVLQAEPNNGTPFNHDQTYYVMATWGQLTIAAVCAMIACLSTGLVGAAFLADEKRVPLDGPRVAAGLAAGTAGGFGIASAYAVVGSFLLGLGPAAFLRWSVLPLLPVPAVIAVTALVVRRRTAPVGGWMRWLRFSTMSIVFVAVGMALLQYTSSITRWNELILYLDLAARVAGVLMGIGLTLAVVSRPLFRIIVGIPLTLFCFAIADWRGAGIIGVMFAVATAAWLAARTWTLSRETTPRTPHAG